MNANLAGGEKKMFRLISLAHEVCDFPVNMSDVLMYPI